MKSKLYKVLHPVMGRPMVQHVTDQLKQLELEKIITVVGFGAEEVEKQIGNESEFVFQEEQLGTGHAVQQAENVLGDLDGTTIVVSGDTPLLTDTTLQSLLDFHDKEDAKVTILTTDAPDPTGYGRVLRNHQGDVARIVEQKDANDEELAVTEINTGTYCFDNRSLFAALKNVSNENSQGEYYLPDVIEILKSQNEKISAFQTTNFEETLGVNDRVALSQAEKIMKKRINEQHMRNGVSIIDAEHTYIEPGVTIEQDVTILPGSVIGGNTHIHSDVVIGPHTEIQDCTVGEGTVIRQSAVFNSEIGGQVNIGPYAHIRPDSSLGDGVKIGNFVEVKKAVIDKNSKVSHLSYIGDAELGADVNIGCGTITVNYDGEKKHLTKIEDGAFIGCNSNLIAPVSVGRGAYVAAGSTINKDVPEEALSIARAKQTNKEDYVKQMKNKKKD